MSETQSTVDPNAGGATTGATTAAATQDNAATTALAAGGNRQDTTTTAQPTWPDDWRQKIIGSDDAKELKRIERYNSPADLWKAYRAAEQRISSGEYKRAEPGENAAPEELAAWRKDNGIPDAANGYFDNLPKGLEIDDAEKPLLEGFANRMHQMGVPPKTVHAALEEWRKQINVVNEELAQGDLKQQQATEDELRAEWGNEYRGNLNASASILSTYLGADNYEALVNARFPDGTKLGNHAGILKGLLALAKEVNPVSTIVPGAAGTGGAGIEEEIANIEKAMRDPKSGYFKDDKMQARYRDLIDARERMKARAA